MNILMLGSWTPFWRRPAAAERLHRFARHLGREHRLTLAFVTDDPNPGAISALREEFGDLEFALIPRGWQRLWSAARLLAGGSAELTYSRSEALKTRVRERLRASAYDLIYVGASSLIPYALDADRSIPILMDFGEVDSQWWTERAAHQPAPWAALYRTEAARLRQLETEAARRAAACLVASRAAAEVVASFAPWAPVTVAPNGVDLPEQIPFRPPVTAPLIALNAWLDEEREVQAAAEFCERVLPAVRGRVPEARLLVAARHLPRSARRLARTAGVEVLDSGADLRLLLRRAAVAVTPAVGGGATRRAVLEAMAFGVPVVTTRRGLDGLAAVPGRDLYAEEGPDALAGRLVDLLGNRSLRAEAGARGFAFVRAHYSWEPALARLDTLLRGLLRRAPVEPAPAVGSPQSAPLAHVDP
jgi:glycosyltransferase involved in cell wall biosynthesis